MVLEWRDGFDSRRLAWRNTRKMDLVCTKCGEPWDLDEVDDMPGLVMEGSRIIKCPCCSESDGG